MRVNSLDFNKEKQDLFSNVGKEEKGGRNDKVEEKSGKHIYGGNINRNLNISDKIEQKRKFAQKQAMKLISEAVAKERASTENIDSMKEQHAQKVAEMAEQNMKIVEFESEKEELRNQYGVSKDSQEQKDLELLQKFQNYKNGVGGESFTKEDISRLKELENIPRTEYQNRVLEINQAQGVAKIKSREAESALEPLSMSIFDSEQEQLKSKDMLDAKDSANDLLKAAEKEIFGMLVQDAKDNIDTKMEEEKKKAEEAAEKKEEREERLEEQKEKTKQQEELISGAMEGNKLKNQLNAVKSVPNSIKDAQMNIHKIITENSLIEEDLKGIKIDFNF